MSDSSLSKESVERCPVAIAAKVLSRRWAILILQTMMTPESADGLRYNEIQKSLHWVSAKVLTERLRDLEEQGILSRLVDSEGSSLRVTYKLTEKGAGLRPTLLAMQEWGRTFGDRIAADCFADDFDNCDSCASKYEC